MKGVINLYKPKGITSSAAVVACRKILGVKAIGHMGTLDPAGEGVLLLGVGKATRLFDYYLKKDKIYEAEFCFGYETDTLDGEGVKLSDTENIPLQSDIENVLGEFVGKQRQVPPSYSAKSVNGVRAYKLARAGMQVDLPSCEIEIYNIRLLGKTAANTYLFEIHCSSGTYIRSVCRDLAYRLDSLATMVSIKRTKCGNFTVDNAVTTDELIKLKEKAIISVEQALSDLPRVSLGDEFYKNLISGVRIEAQPRSGDYALYCKNELFGIANNDGGYIKIKTYLRD